jgi:hypothetical protein
MTQDVRVLRLIHSIHCGYASYLNRIEDKGHCHTPGTFRSGRGMGSLPGSGRSQSGPEDANGGFPYPSHPYGGIDGIAANFAAMVWQRLRIGLEWAAGRSGVAGAAVISCYSGRALGRGML